mgnify:CR=1 FL=1
MLDYGDYPTSRPRRRRTCDAIRSIVSEHQLASQDLILPLFVQEGHNTESTVNTLPGVCRYSIDLAVIKAKEAYDLGIKAVALFPVVEAKYKSDDASHAYDSDNLMCRTLRAFKEEIPEILTICDVALDPYTLSGHDGLTDHSGNVLNDPTVEVLLKQSLALADAGCDVIAPSDMMDGRIGAIRNALDDKGHQEVAILSYAVKYASSFYGPFRDAVGSANNLKKASKSTYQMDFHNSTEALEEVAHDIKQGADMVMVKPAGCYLDIIHLVRQHTSFPIFAYQVSGEYAAIKSADSLGWGDSSKLLYESMIALKRAGANAIITYGAIELAKKMKESQ